MKKNVSSVLLFLAFSILVVSYNSCGNPNQYNFKGYGTTVGNPFAPTQAANKVLSAMCLVLSQCNSGLTIGDCNAGVMATTGVAPALGLTQDGSEPYSSIVQSEQSESITANMTAASSCVSAISALSCSAPQVQQAHVSGASNPYSNVAGMIPTTGSADCSGVFSNVPGESALIWSFDTSEISGTTVLDSSGSSNNGTSVNATSVTGVMGQALSFTGSGNSNVTANAYSSYLDFTGSRTLTAWVNTTSSAGTIAGTYAATGLESGFELVMNYGYLNLITSAGLCNGSARNTFASTTNLVNDGQWHFVAASFDLTAGSINLYVDGNNVLNQTASGFVSCATTSSFVVGQGSVYGNFSGSIDEVRVYDRVLSQSDIFSLANQ